MNKGGYNQKREKWCMWCMGSTNFDLLVHQGRKSSVADKIYQSEEEEERQKKLKQDVIASALRKGGERPTTIRELGSTALKNLPTNISMIQSLMKAVNWR